MTKREEQYALKSKDDAERNLAIENRKYRMKLAVEDKDYNNKEFEDEVEY